jgi:hypothetical protein
VFKPNEYFYKKHQMEGEERWETYARVIRDLMSANSHLTLADIDINDKFKYKEHIWPTMKGKYSD